MINNRSISVEKLNIMIEFLFYLKEDGNLAAHPKPNNRNSNIILNEINTDDSITKDNKKFFESLINAFKKVDFKNNYLNNELFECLFDGKCENILSFIESGETREISEINEQMNHLNFSNEIETEFENIEKEFDSLKAFHESLLSTKIDKTIINQTILKDFYNRLYKSLKNKESALEFLRNILSFEYENSLFGDMTYFIKGCFDYIINNLLKNYEKNLQKLEYFIISIKSKRKENRKLIETFRKLNKKTSNFEENEKEKIKNNISDNFICFLNRKRNADEEKIKETDGKEILISVREILETLVKEKINWAQFDRQKLSSLLCLYQNQS